MFQTRKIGMYEARMPNEILGKVVTKALVAEEHPSLLTQPKHPTSVRETRSSALLTKNFSEYS
ncbi:MAG: hypothetical protein ACTSXX_14265 [Candidatus Baldrarchaeia archaeon]